MTLIIERGVPVPPRMWNGKPSETADAVKRMQVGDSVLFDKQHKASFASEKLKKMGHTATMRKVEGGYRVWRLAPSAALKVAAE